MLNLNTPLRSTQAVLAIITLGFNGYVTHWYLTHTTPSIAPNGPLWLLFVGTWSLLIMPYLFFNPPLQITHQNRAQNSRFFNKWVVLVLDIVTCIFWFAGFVDLAIFKAHLVICGGHVCAFMGWGSAVGALAWLAYLATSVLATWHVARTRGGSSTTQPQSHGAWVGMQQKAQA